MVDPHNHDIVHHLGLLECNAKATFDDNNLPDGLCDDIIQDIYQCFVSVASIWAVGGDEVCDLGFFS